MSAKSAIRRCGPGRRGMAQLAGTAFLHAAPGRTAPVTPSWRAPKRTMRTCGKSATRTPATMSATWTRRKEWGQAGFMLLTAVMQVKAKGGGQVLAENYPAFQQAPAWLYGAYMGCLGQLRARGCNQSPICRSGQSLAFAWLYWRQYAERGTRPAGSDRRNVPRLPSEARPRVGRESICAGAPPADARRAVEAPTNCGSRYDPIRLLASELTGHAVHG